jgi:peptidoglycan/xylan/chitin deacetylase (PgdA/CDA1 family)
LFYAKRSPLKRRIVFYHKEVSWPHGSFFVLFSFLFTVLPLSLMMMKKVLQKREVRTALAIAFTVVLFFLLNDKMTRLEDVSAVNHKDPTAHLLEERVIITTKKISNINTLPLVANDTFSHRAAASPNNTVEENLSIGKRSTTTVPILVYHKILAVDKQAGEKRPSLKKFNVDPEIFKEQMSYVALNGYTVLTMRDLLQKVDEKNMPKKPLVITFDDGWKSQYQNAIPVLSLHHFPATFYIYTGVIGSPASMSWDELKDLSVRGMEIGGHTKTHAKLTKVPLLQLHSELSESKTQLEKKLDITVTNFAYPYGMYNDLVIKAVKQAGYTSARTSQQIKYNDFKDRYQLNALYAPDTLEEFKRVLD